MTEKKPVAVFGCSGHGRSLGDMLSEFGTPVIYLDDDPKGMKVSGGSEKLQDEAFLREHLVAIGIGDNKLRQHFSMVVLQSGGLLKDVKHPRSTLSKSAIHGMGCVLFPNAIVGSGAKLENFVVINNKASVAHDCIIRDAAQIADGATLGGGVIVGKRTLIGMGATVLPRVKIGNDVIVGCGSVVTKDVPDGKIVKGIPAK